MTTSSRVLIFIFLLAIILRLGFGYFIFSETFFLSGSSFQKQWTYDQYEYISIAKNLIAGKGFVIGSEPTAWRAPLYPFLLAFWFRIFGLNFSYIALQIAVDVILVYLVFLIALKVYENSSVAILAAFFVAINPSLWISAAQPLSENIFNFLLVLTFLLLLQIKSSEYLSPKLLSVGFIFGLATLARPAAILLLLAVALYLYLLFNRNLKETFQGLLLILVIFLLTISPWLARNYLLFNQAVFIATNGFGTNLLLGNNDSYLRDAFFDPTYKHTAVPDKQVDAEIRKSKIKANSEAVLDKYRGKAAFSFIKKHPLAYLFLTARRFFFFWSPTDSLSVLTKKWPKVFLRIAFWILTFPMAFYGMVVSMRSHRKQSLLFLTTIVIVTVFTALTILDNDQRLRLPLEPFLSIFAAFAYFQLYHKWKKNSLTNETLS